MEKTGYAGWEARETAEETAQLRFIWKGILNFGYRLTRVKLFVLFPHVPLILSFLPLFTNNLSPSYVDCTYDNLLVSS